MKRIALRITLLLTALFGAATTVTAGAQNIYPYTRVSYTKLGTSTYYGSQDCTWRKTLTRYTADNIMGTVFYTEIIHTYSDSSGQPCPNPGRDWNLDT